MCKILEVLRQLTPPYLDHIYYGEKGFLSAKDIDNEISEIEQILSDRRRYTANPLCLYNNSNNNNIIIIITITTMNKKLESFNPALELHRYSLK